MSSRDNRHKQLPMHRALTGTLPRREASMGPRPAASAVRTRTRNRRPDAGGTRRDAASVSGSCTPQRLLLAQLGAPAVAERLVDALPRDPVHRVAATVEEEERLFRLARDGLAEVAQRAGPPKDAKDVAREAAAATDAGRRGRGRRNGNDERNEEAEERRKPAGGGHGWGVWGKPGEGGAARRGCKEGWEWEPWAGEQPPQCGSAWGVCDGWTGSRLLWREVLLLR